MTRHREPYIVLQRKARRQLLRAVLLRFLLAGPPHFAAPAAVGPDHGCLHGQCERVHVSRPSGHGRESNAAVLHAVHSVLVRGRHRA